MRADLSILVSICALRMLGQTLNIMTLGGLALAVGILVDDATVEIENDYRHLSLGTPLRQAILDAAPEVGSVLVPAGDGRGTKAVLRRPAALLSLRFGNDSFKPHLAAAQASGQPCVVLSLPGIAVDVDNPADLRQLAELPGETRAQHLARRWNLSDYPLAANE